MLAPALVFLLCGATAELEVEGRAGVSPNTAGALARELANAIARRTGLEVTVSEDREAAGARQLEAASPIRVEPAEEHVSLRVFGGLTKLRVIADRRSRHGAEVHVEVELPSSTEVWGDAVETLAERLFPPRPALDRASLEGSLPHVKEERPHVVRWILGGAAVVSAGVGVAFAASAASARASLEDSPHTDAEVAALDDTRRGRGLASGLLFGAAACLFALGFVLD